MTLESKINKNRYIGNGVTTQFPFTFKIWKTDQILVFVGDGDTEQDVSAYCTIEITPSGGTVTFSSAPPNGSVIILRRKMPYIQEDDYRNGTRFDSEEIEDRFDQDCAERQDLRLDVDRAIKVPETSSLKPEELWIEIKKWHDDVLTAIEQGQVSIIYSNEVVSRHDGITSSGAGNYPNFFLAVPEATAIANRSVHYDSGAGRDVSHINDVVAIGYDTLQNALNNTNKRCSSNIAIGSGVMCKGTYVGPHNIGIGLWALHDLQSTKPNDANSGGFDADRNVAVGTLCFPHLTQGRANVGLGRDIGQGLTTGSYNVCVGYASMGGFAPVGLDGTIVNDGLLTGNFNTAVGTYALHSLCGDASSNVAIGAYAADSVKTGSGNIYIGRFVGRYIDYYTSVNGKKLKRLSSRVQYAQTGTSLYVSLEDSGAVVGGYVILAFHSGGIYDGLGVKGDNQTLYVTAVDSEGFTVESPIEYSGASGEVTVRQIELADTQALVGAENAIMIGFGAAQYIQNVAGSNVIGAYALRGTNLEDLQTTDKGSLAQYSNILGSLSALQSRVQYSEIIGYRVACDGQTYAQNGYGSIGYSFVSGTGALRYAPSIQTSVFIGYASGENVHEDVSQSVAIGCNVCRETTNGLSGSVVIGYNSGNRAKVKDDVFIGSNAGSGENITQSQNCVFIGNYSMGTDSYSGSVSNSIAIGHGTKVTGSNQCQLGNSDVTVYAYGSVQDRSDARDKTDIRDTVLGLDFILALRPIDFKWDYREDYIETIKQDIESEDEYGLKTTRTVFETIKHKKDGSRKRKRYHSGLIAQEVKAVIDEKGIDFGGYQDHKINGGEDVLTLGYEEFIAPIVKSIQELNTRLEALEGV